jgi:hypothetical protein
VSRRRRSFRSFPRPRSPDDEFGQAPNAAELVGQAPNAAELALARRELARQASGPEELGP